MLAAKYSKAMIIRFLRTRRIAKGIAGRHADNKGNLAGVYAYIEFYRTRQQAGRALGVGGAAQQLKCDLDRYTVNCRISAGRLRGMYYQAKHEGQKDRELKSLMDCEAAQYDGNEVRFPLLFTRENGSWVSAVIDTYALRARPR